MFQLKILRLIKTPFLPILYFIAMSLQDVGGPLFLIFMNSKEYLKIKYFPIPVVFAVLKRQNCLRLIATQSP